MRAKIVHLFLAGIIAGVLASAVIKSKKGQSATKKILIKGDQYFNHFLKGIAGLLSKKPIDKPKLASEKEKIVIEAKELVQKGSGRS